jgi:YggT family protein
MSAIASPALWFIDALLNLAVLALILNAVLSWLVAFDIINLRNRVVYSIAHFLEAVTRPMLRPLQKFIPTLGGVDITPIILILIIGALQRLMRGVAASNGILY